MTKRIRALVRVVMALQVVALIGLLAQWPLTAYSCHNARAWAPNGLGASKLGVATVSCVFVDGSRPYFILDVQLLPVAFATLVVAVGVVVTAVVLRADRRTRLPR
ncbi:hypothetical protein [Saccharothrix coeruleofusca]|uniref:Uncharacterized protein n=1 Tax=Saccharothrix coeruleofusca TaxID=33919 RepID=A0A918APR1_9PSEU|nr:hypothetical protein [Saccharothrix coeruleofusca]GGP68065.1 hypothetical protein GCM10010185_46060 [Saccharothrix coeruleofusca]